MPPFTVPTAQRRITREPLPGARQQVSTTATEFGGARAEAFVGIGRELQDVSETFRRAEEAELKEEQKINIALEKQRAEVQERKDKMYADAALLEFQEAWSTNKNDFLGTRRLNADNVTEKVKAWYTKTKSGILGRAANDRQKELISAKINPEITMILNKVSDHEIKELLLNEQEQQDSLYANAVSRASAPDSNVVDRKSAELTAIEALNQKYKGYDAEARNKGVAEGMAAFHVSVINGKLVDDLEFAKQYFKDIKQAIPPKEREEVRKLIKKEDIYQTSNRLANDIILKESDNVKWQDMVDKATSDPDIRDKTKSILEARKKDDDAHTEELKKRALLDGLDKIREAPNLTAALAEADKIDDPLDAEKARKYANARYERKKRDVETNINVYTDVLDRINNGEFKEVRELNEFYPDLSTSHFDKAVSALNSKLGKDGDVIKYSTAKDAFSVALGEKYNVEDISQNRKFKVAYDSLTDAGITDFDTAVKHLKNLFIEGEVIEGGWLGLWDSDMDRTTAERENKIDKWLPNILTEDEDPTLSELRTIQNNLRALGVTTKNDIINRLYKKSEILKLPLSKAEIDQYRKLLRENSGFKQIER